MNSNSSRFQLIEYFWDERTGHSQFIYEDEKTGELDVTSSFQPLKKPVADDELRASYFAGLKFWLDTQPLYD